jgi:hypothetical protein
MSTTTLRTVYTLTIGPSDVTAGDIDWRCRERTYDDGQTLDETETSGGRATRSAPTTREGWLAYCRRHGGEIRPGSWRQLRWSDADIRDGGYDYRNGAVLTWEN